MTTAISLMIAVFSIGLFALLGSLEYSLRRIATLLEKGTVQVRDVDRAKVYSEHLGEKLR
jgi:hypothetical protein